MEPNSSENQCNLLKYIMKHINLYEHVKLLGRSTPTFCKLNIISLDNMVKRYREVGLMNDEHQFKHDIEMDMV